jgi:hypothetical protein
MDEEVQVKKVLEARQLGLEKKDIGFYMSAISPCYRGERGNWGHLRRETMEMMAGVDSIQVCIASWRILISRGRGEAVQAYEIRFAGGTR